ncbi:hypothetical protein ACI2JT_23280, partial [Pseudoalteromonas rhizosphaerae]
AGGEIKLDSQGNATIIATNILTLDSNIVTFDGPVDYDIESPQTASSPSASSPASISRINNVNINDAGVAATTASVVDLEYVYQDGSPVKNAPYTIEFDDGTKQTGQLDDSGQAQLTNIPSGQFSVKYGEDSRDFQPEDNTTPNPLYGQITTADAVHMINSGNTAKLEEAGNLANQAGDWLWGTLQGDFNRNPSTSQIVVGTIISMIPVVDQIMDIRDICANTVLLTDDDKANDSDGWIAFTLTAIGLVPLLGSAVKGVGKVVIKNSGESMEAAIAVLRKMGKGDPVKYLREINWQDLGKQAASEVKAIIKSFRDTLQDISTSWKYDLLLPDSAIDGMQAMVKQLDEVTPKIDQGVKNAANEIGNRVNKALDEFEPPASTGVVGKPKKTVANELEPPKGNDLKGAKVANRSIDELLINGKVPSIRNNKFNEWYNNLSLEEMRLLWDDKSIRESIESRIRKPGGYHEWYMVARTPKFKEWGLPMEEIKRVRTKISELKWKVPNSGTPGMHGKKGSGTFHKELLEIIDNSKSLNQFHTQLETLITRWKIDPSVLPK